LFWHFFPENEYTIYKQQITIKYTHRVNKYWEKNTNVVKSSKSKQIKFSLVNAA